MKIALVGADLLHADRQTDRHNEVVNSFLQIFECA